jgi:hypothetical protein
MRSASANTVAPQTRLSTVSPQNSRSMIVSPEKKATTPGRGVMRVNVEKPCTWPHRSSRSRMTASFSRRSASKRSRVVPSK